MDFWLFFFPFSLLLVCALSISFCRWIVVAFYICLEIASEAYMLHSMFFLDSISGRTITMKFWWKYHRQMQLKIVYGIEFECSEVLFAPSSACYSSLRSHISISMASRTVCVCAYMLGRSFPNPLHSHNIKVHISNQPKQNNKNSLDFLMHSDACLWHTLLCYHRIDSIGISIAWIKIRVFFSFFFGFFET